MPRILRRPENTRLHTFHGMITASPLMLELFELIEKVARTDANVLVRGATGTGKELVAQALHHLSGRSEGPFQAINCATLTPDLLASELFGHRRGAFTGAVSDRLGLFALADGGTVFLDEIAEMPLDIQARLLRVLQEKTFVPLGGTTSVEVDVRVLSATNKALRQEVGERRFREDLMYRIRVVPLFLPRLADREGDVLALSWQFISQFNQRGLRQVNGIDQLAADAMQSYPWPGNVRELLNVIEYAFAIGDGPILTVDELTPELRGEQPYEGEAVVLSSRDEERRSLLEALGQAHGRKAEAARLLHMSRTTLWRKLREHGIG